MIIEMPAYSEKTLNQFAEKEWNKALAFLQKRFQLTEDDCADIFQDAFMVLLRNNREGKLKDMTATLSTYFLSICKNKAMEMLRSHGRLTVAGKESDVDYPDEVQDEKIEFLLTFDSDCSLIEQKEAIARQIVRDLPEPCDKILWGFFRDNLKLKTIADMLRSTEESIKVRKHRCQEKFRRRYSELVRHLF